MQAPVARHYKYGSRPRRIASQVYIVREDEIQGLLAQVQLLALARWLLVTPQASALPTLACGEGAAAMAITSPSPKGLYGGTTL